MLSSVSLRLQAGITLLEILIALSIFSVVGVAAYQVLQSTIDGQNVGDEYSQQLSQQLKTFMIMDSDLQQIVQRRVRAVDGTASEAIVVNADEFPLLITRGGRRNPLGQARSHLQRIAYDVGPHPMSSVPEHPYYQNETQFLRRYQWPTLDSMDSSEPQVQVLIGNIDSLTVVAITEQGEQEVWPIAGETQDQPGSLRAIRLSFNHTWLGEFQRIYSVAAP